LLGVFSYSPDDLFAGKLQTIGSFAQFEVMVMKSRQGITLITALLFLLQVTSLLSQITMPIKSELIDGEMPPNPGCFVVAVNWGETSGNSLAPTALYAFARSVYLLRHDFLSGLPAGAPITAIGWQYAHPPEVEASAPLTIYMENTTDTTNLKSTNWATAINGMTIVHSATTTLPGIPGPFYVPLVGGSTFTYDGGALYIAFDWGPYTGPPPTTASVACSSFPGTGTLLRAQSNVAAPTTLAYSDFVPTTRLNSGSCPAAITVAGGSFNCSDFEFHAPVPNVVLELRIITDVVPFDGYVLGSITSGNSSDYLFSLVPSGTYRVTPSKAAIVPGSAGTRINTIDVIAVQRHFLMLGVPLVGCRLLAGDVNADTFVDTVDTIAIQRFFLGLTTGIANLGTYQFDPVFRFYPDIVHNRIDQDYDALIFGDVAPPFER